MEEECKHSVARGYMKSEYSKSEIEYCRICNKTLKILSTTKLKEFIPYIKPKEEIIITNKKLF